MWKNKWSGFEGAYFDKHTKLPEGFDPITKGAILLNNI